MPAARTVAGPAHGAGKCLDWPNRRGSGAGNRRRCAAGAWQLDRDPYLLETSVPGIFACGDVRLGPVKRVAAAVGEGSMAIAFVHQYLRDADAKPVLAASR